VLARLAASRSEGWYDLKRELETDCSVIAGYSSRTISAVLKRLAEQGLIEGVREATAGGRVRVAYSLTIPGRIALQRWGVSACELPVSGQSELLGRLLAAEVVGLTETIKVFKQASEEFLGRLERVSRRRTIALASGNLVHRLEQDLHHSLAMAQHDWLERSIQELEARQIRQSIEEQRRAGEQPAASGRVSTARRAAGDKEGSH
jgi:DNA-binding PadR family transcriptional regulator